MKNLDDRLNIMLKDNLILKYTKNETKSYEELIFKTIELEIANNALEKKLDVYNFEICKLNQHIIDLNTELCENRIKMNINMNMNSTGLEKITCTSIEKSVKNKNKKDESNDNSNINYFHINEESSIIEELSVEDENSLLDKLKKHNQKSKKNKLTLDQENYNLRSDLNYIVKEAKGMKDKIAEYCNLLREKDNVISILHKEIDNLKSNVNAPLTSQRSHTSDLLNSPNFKKPKKESFTFNTNVNGSVLSDSQGSVKKFHLENLDFIKNCLVEFLKNYGIHENFSKNCEGINNNNFQPGDRDIFLNNVENSTGNVDYLIDVRMKELKYILVNLKKINIIFKSLFVEFTKNLITSYEVNFNQTIHIKLDQLEKKFNKMGFKSKINKTNQNN
jgi:hypothetical protein